MKMSAWLWVPAVLLCVAVAGVWLSLPEQRLRDDIQHQYGIRDAQFMRSMGLMIGPPIVDGNATAELLNGDRIFPAMLQDIRSARRSVLFETYIYWDGDVGREFASALSERARAGVKVHVLLDWVGSAKIDDALLEQMRSAGVEIGIFHPLKWYNLGRLNNRTHRKLLIVDGAVGFTGGVGIAPVWTGDAQDPSHWRDTHFRVQGPVVAQMQAVMLDNWGKTSGKVLHGDVYFPPLQPAGAQKAQMFSSSPNGGSESMLMMYHVAIAAAERSIDISSSYFVPDALTLRALVAAARRGVKIRIITPGKHMDAETVRRASRGLWGELLKAGIEMHEYQPTMYHCKVMVVDGFMTSVGSTNIDVRSFRLNDEANLNIYDEAFALRQTQVFEDDLRKAQRITLEAWNNRPLSEKLYERAMAAVGDLL